MEETELLDIENDEKYQNYYNKLINTSSQAMIETQRFSEIEKVIDMIINPFLAGPTRL